MDGGVMDSPITRAEHEEFRRTVDAELEMLAKEDKRLHERLKVVEGISCQLTEVTATLQKQSDNIDALSKNIESLAQAHTADAERLEKLEGKDGEKWRKMWSYIIPILVSLAIGILAGYFGL